MYTSGKINLKKKCMDYKCSPRLRRSSFSAILFLAAAVSSKSTTALSKRSSSTSTCNHTPSFAPSGKDVRGTTSFSSSSPTRSTAESFSNRSITAFVSFLHLKRYFCRYSLSNKTGCYNDAPATRSSISSDFPWPCDISFVVGSLWAKSLSLAWTGFVIDGYCTICSRNSFL